MHGFAEGRSTVTNLVCKTQYISEILDWRGQVDVIYIDFSKAFDKLDLGLLLCKLDGVGLGRNLIALFKTYLTRRTQFVLCHGDRSFNFAQTSGVPQGSFLGPLMFVIYVNDIATILGKLYLVCRCFKKYCQVKSLLDCIKIQRNSNLISSWCIDNHHLPLNVSKCNVMSFCRKNDTLNYNYALDGVALRRPDLVSDLGVTFDPKFTFANHIDNNVATAYESLDFVIRNMKDFKSILLDPNLNMRL